MQCTRCGTENPGAAAFCLNCGNAIAAPLTAPEAVSLTAVAGGPSRLPAPPPTAPLRPNSEALRARIEHPELVGIRGWLLLFCIFTTISPFITVELTIQHAGYPVVKLFLLAVAAYTFFTSVNLWQVTEQALNLTKVLLATYFWIAVVVAAIQIMTDKFGISRSPNIIGPIIWWFYFKESKRVKATFLRTF